MRRNSLYAFSEFHPTDTFQAKSPPKPRGERIKAKSKRGGSEKRKDRETTCELCEHDNEQCSSCAAWDEKQEQWDEDRREELGDWGDE